MIGSIKRLSLPFLVGFTLLALTTPKVHSQSRSMRSRPPMTPQQFHFNQNGFNRARPFLPSTQLGFDPFLRRPLGFDPFLRREFGFDPLLRREFGFDPFLRRRFGFEPSFGTGIFGFPNLALTPLPFVF